MTEKQVAIVDSKTAVASARQLQRRYDRWENSVNKFGSANDPMTITGYQPGLILNRAQIDNLYEFDWITGKIIDIPAADATREWLTYTHETDPKKVEQTTKETERLKLRSKTEEAEKLARLYGGALMIMGAFDGKDMAEPLEVNKIRFVDFIHVVDRWMVYPLTFDTDPMSPTNGDVETYVVHRAQIIGVETSVVHASRVIRFDGRYLPPFRRLRNFGWQGSFVTRLYEVIRQFGVSTQAGSATLQDHVIKKVKINNLQELVDGGQWDTISTRLSMMAQEISMTGLAVYGEDEDIEKIGTPINQLPKLMEMFIDYVSAAGDIPRARLFQNMSGSLGGDPGRNDLRVHYDNIAAMQENKLRGPVQRATDIIMAPFGAVEGEMGFVWNTLWQMDESEKADVGLKTAQRDQIYVQIGVVEPEEVALSRFSGETFNTDLMTIDLDRRKKAIEDLKSVDLIRPEPEFDDQLKLEPPNDDDKDRSDKAPNITARAGKDPHGHTFDLDHTTGNGQTIDTLDDAEPHVHVIREYRMFEAGADNHTHVMYTSGNIPGDLTKRE